MSWCLNQVKEDGNKNFSFKNLFEEKKVFSSPTAQYTGSKPDLKERRKKVNIEKGVSYYT